MRKAFILLLILWSFGSQLAQAQSFSVEGDTMTYMYNVAAGGAQNVRDSIKLPESSSPVTLKWYVCATNFPADWIANCGICDNTLCFPMSGLWPSGSAATKTTSPYTISGTHDFHLQLNLGSVTTTGTYYVKVRLNNSAIPGDTATQTYIVSRSPASVSTINAVANDIMLYPNPAHTDINIQFGSGSGIAALSVYNIIGKAVAAYKVAGTSANINLEALQSGVYFVRMSNAQGELVATRKFVKN